MCNCQCREEFFDQWEEPIPYRVALTERNQFQGALDEIAVIVDGKDITQLTQADLEAIQAEVLKR